MARLTTCKGKRGGATKRAVETQIARIKKKMNQSLGYKPGTPKWATRPIRSRAAIVNYLWAEWARLKSVNSQQNSL